MRSRSSLACRPASWRGRQAFLLENDVIRLITLTGGGHIAEFRFRDGCGPSTMNPLWIPPWRTIEPYRYEEKAHAAVYGPPAVGRMISGIVGHNLCLDYFGNPSEEEARQGLSIHGEAPSVRWRKVRARASKREVTLELAVRLPAAGLRFRRQIKIRRGESVVYFREEVVNEAKADHFCHGTQHVTLDLRFSRPDWVGCLFQEPGAEHSRTGTRAKRCSIPQGISVGPKRRGGAERR
jgi:hypothetical protein